MAVSVTGILGFGLGAHVYCAWELDSGGGRAGKARRLGVDNDGHPKDEFNCGGAVAKLRFSSTELRYAEPRVKTPVFASSDRRQLPETATACVHPAPCAAPRPCGAGGTGCQPDSPGGGISLGRALCITLAACKPGSTCGRARAGKESALVLTGRYCCNCNASCLSWRLRSNGNASSSPYGALYQLP